MRKTSEDDERGGSLPSSDMTVVLLDIKRNDAQRLLLINDIPVQFSPLEYRVTLALIARVGAPVSFETLTRAAAWPGEAPCSRVALERHIDRVRQKLRVCAIEIRGVTGYGCILLASCA